MLVIAATEPCSLRHSDPPRTTDLQSPPVSGLRTIPLRSMPKFGTGSPSSVTNLPGPACKTSQSHGKDAASCSSAQTNTATPSSAIAEQDHSKLVQKSEADKDLAKSSPTATPKSHLSQPKSTPPVSSSSAVSTAVPSLTSDTVEPVGQPESGQSEQAWQYKQMGIKSIVDFEKIYQFISNIALSKNTQPLTTMGM